LKITRDPVSVNTVRTLARGAIVVGDTTFTTNIGLTTNAVIENWPDCAIDELCEGTLAPILDHSPELLVLGSGWTHQFAPRELVFALARRGIGFEVMDTPAACRTFNILVAEGRLPAAVFYNA